MQYFFLTDGWTLGRVWELGGLWDELVWRRKPDIERLNLGIWENQEKLWLYRVEDAVLMIEVLPGAAIGEKTDTIGQVVLKRLITADQAIERLCKATIVPENLSPFSEFGGNMPGNTASCV